MILMRRIFLVTSLVCLLATTAVFGLNIEHSWAANSFTQQPIIMDMSGMTKKVEGKVQETYGDVTENQKDQIVGKAKQVQGEAILTTEEIKENVGNMTKKVQIEGTSAPNKLQELLDGFFGKKG